MKNINFCLEELEEPLASQDEIDGATNGINDALESMTSLLNIRTIAIEAVSPSVALAKTMNIAVESIAKGLKLEIPTSTIAIESIDGSTSISTESIADILRSIWKGIVATFKWLWKKIKAFFGFTSKSDKKAKMEMALKRAEEIAAASKKGMVIVDSDKFDELNALATQHHGTTHQQHPRGETASMAAEVNEAVNAAEASDKDEEAERHGAAVLEPFRYLDRDLSISFIGTVYSAEYSSKIKAFSDFVQLLESQSEWALSVVTETLHSGMSGYDDVYKEDPHTDETILGGQSIFTPGDISDVDRLALAEKYNVTPLDINQSSIRKLEGLVGGSKLALFTLNETNQLSFLYYPNTTKPTDRVNLLNPSPEELRDAFFGMKDAVELWLDTNEKLESRLEKINVRMSALDDAATKLLAGKGHESMQPEDYTKAALFALNQYKLVTNSYWAIISMQGMFERTAESIKTLALAVVSCFSTESVMPSHDN